jgi:uridine kinase
VKVSIFDPLRRAGAVQKDEAVSDESSGGSCGIAAVVDRILSLELAHPVRVAVDGRTASGKTTFADDLGRAIMAAGRAVIRASVDGFHHPAKVRHRRGRLSADGYYEDARDLDAIRDLLLEPLGPGGDRCYVTRTFDLERDQPVESVAQRAEEGSILIVDGTFLQRPELKSAWDFVIFLDVSEHEARQRGINRDAAAMGGQASASELYTRRYAPAFSRYESECNPAESADLVVDN